MSTSIDERVVQMKFNNAQFESGVKTTLETLDKLKNSLNLDGAAKGLSSLARAGSSFTLSGVSSAAETVGNKFSMLEEVAIGALRRIGEKAADIGVNLVKSLSIDNITTGWDKFGKKTGSVATLVAQGFDIETVNEQLERLNWFTDETSYNFTDMVSEISKFTASGQDLEGSVTAMEGIANWAALSGQNATTASRAMYQLSQAMGKGALRYDDWKSIQNASMDTQEFRKQALAAAEAVGTVRKELDGTYTTINDGEDSGNFTMQEMFTSDALTKKQWITSDVMMKTFKQYAAAVDDIYDYAQEKGITASEAIAELGGDIDEFGLKAFKAAQEARTWTDVLDSVKDAVSTGWMNTFENVFGNADEATKVWTWWANELYDVFAGSAEKRNEILSLWKEAGGRDAGVEGIYYAWNNLVEVLDTIKSAVSTAFGVDADESVLAGRLVKLTKTFRDFAKSITPSGKQLASLWSVLYKISSVAYKLATIVGKVLTTGFRLLTNVLKIVKEAFVDTFPEDAFDNVNSFLDDISMLIDGFELSEMATNNLKRAFEGLFSIFNTLAGGFLTFWNVFSGPAASTFGELSEGILDLVGSFGDFLSTISDIADKTDIINTVAENIRNILTVVKEEFVGAFGLDTIGEDLVSTLDGWASTFETFATSVTSNKDKLDEFRDTISKVFDVAASLKDLIVTSLKVAFDDLKTVLTVAKEAFEEVIPNETLDNIKSFIDDIKNIVSNLKISDETAEKLKSTFKGIWAVLDLVGQALFAVWDVIAKPIIDVIMDMADSIFGLTGDLGEFVVGLDEAARQSDFFHTVLSGIMAIISPFKEGITGLSALFKNLKVGDIGSIVTEIGNSFIDIFSNVLESGDLTNSIALFVGNLLNGFGTAMNQVDIWNVIFGGLKFLVVGKAFAGVMGFLNALQKGLTSIAKIPTAFVNVLDGLSSSLKSLSLNLKADAMKDIAIAIGILVASLWVLASLDGDALNTAVGSLLLIMGMLILLFKQMEKANNMSAIIAEGNPAAAISGFISSMGNALSQAVTLKAIGSFFKSLGLTLLMIAAAIRILTAGDITMEEIQQASLILMSIAGVIGVLMLLSQALKDTKAVSALGNAFLKISFAFIMMSAAIRILTAGEVDMGQIAIAAGILSGITAIVAILMLLSSALNAGKVVAMGAAFTAISSSFILMAAAIRILTAGKISMSDITQASLILMAMSGIIATLMLISSALSVGKITAMGAAFSAMSASILIIAVAIRMLGSISWQSALSAAGGISAVLLAMVLALGIISTFDSGGSIASLLAITVAIVAISAALSGLAMSGAGIAQVGALAAALLVLVGVGFLVEKLKLGIALETIGKALLLIGSVVLVVGAGVLLFALAMSMLAENSDAIPGIMENIGLGIVAFGNAITNNTQALFIFIATMALVAITAVAVGYAVSKIVQGIAIVAETVSKVLNEFSDKLPSMKAALIAGIAILVIGVLEFLTGSMDSLVSTIIKLMIIAINSISIAILENGEQIGEALGNLIYALGALVIELIGGLIASVVNNIIPGAGDGIKNKLDEAFGSNSPVQTNIKKNNAELRDQVEDDFSKLVPAAQAGLDSSGTVDPTGMFGGNQVEQMTKSAAAENAEVYTLELTEDIENADPPDTAKALSSESQKAEQRAAAKGNAEAYTKAYADEVANADIPVAGEDHGLQAREPYYYEGVENAEVYRSGEVDGFSEPVGIDPSEAYVGFDYYQKGYESGSDTMDGSEQAIVDGTPGVTETAGYGMDEIIAAYTDTEGMSNAASLDLGAYAEQLSIGGLDVSNVAGGIGGNVISGFADPEGAGAAGFSMIDSYGSSIANNGSVATDAASTLSGEVTDNLSGSYDTAFTSGENVANGFAAGMYSKRSAISTAAETISTSASNSFDNSSTNAFAKGADVTTQFGNGIVSKKANVQLSAKLISDAVAKNFGSALAAAKTNGVSMGENYAAGIISTVRVIYAAASYGTNQANAAFRAGSSTAYVCGRDLTYNFAKGISDYASYASSAASSVVSKVADAFKEFYETGYKYGKLFDQGVAKGISDYIDSAARAALALAQKIQQTVKKELGINSPSQVGMELGKFFDFGVRNGIAQYSDRVYDSAEIMADEAVNAFGSVANRIASIIDGTLDLDPTIRPVLDLSDIQNRTAQLNGMLSGSYSYAASAFSGIGGLSTTDQILGGLGTIAAKLNDTRPMPTINVTVNAGNVDDPEELAEIISDRIQFKYAQLGASIGG